MTTTIKHPDQLSVEQQELLRGAMSNRGCLLVCTRSDTHGKAVRTRTQKFCDPDDPKVAARYIDAVKDLVRMSLVTPRTREAYDLTNVGWHIGRKLK